jgi:hypothetical protein
MWEMEPNLHTNPQIAKAVPPVAPSFPEPSSKDEEKFIREFIETHRETLKKLA